MRVISACIIGGTSLIGGEGSILGAVLGIVMLNVINNGLVLLSVSVYWQDLISGAILLLAVTIDFLSQQRKQRARIQHNKA
jgi:ribose transport system permease protein